MSLGTAKRQERDLQRRITFDKAMPLQSRDASGVLRDNFEPIGCLRCVNCRVTSETNISDNIVRIYCEKTKRMRPAHLDPDCPHADPRPARPRKLHRLWCGANGKHRNLGDRSGAATPLLLLYLKHFWTTAPTAKIEAQTTRTINGLRAIVRSYGIGGRETVKNRIALSGLASGRKFFTPEQTAWLVKIYNSAELWPRVLTHNRSEADRAEILKRRDWVIETVATMGPRWEWEQIIRHLDKRRSRANRKRKRTVKV